MKRILAIIVVLSLCLTGCGTRLSPAGELRLLPEGEEPVISPGVPLLNTEEHVPYMEAFPSGRFLPEVVMRRGEICQILYALMANPMDGSCSFSDVRPGSPYYESVACLTAWGIVSDSTGEFRPNDLISWAQLLTMLSRFYPAPQEGEAPYIGSFLGRRAELEEGQMLPDMASFSGIRDHWACDAIENAVARGWLSPGGSFNPDQAVTRAEFCRLMNTVLDRRADLGMAAFLDHVPQFPDVPPSHPDYPQILEACCAHEYSRSEDGTELWRGAELSPGFHRRNGQLFYVTEEGEFLRNGSVGLLDFDEYGRYTCGVAATDAKIAEILRSLGTDDMTQEQALRAAYTYCIRNKTYIKHTWASYGCTEDRHEHAYRALKFYETNSGVCYDYAAGFGLLARALGYSNAYIVFARINEFYAPHGWVVIPENGVNYIYDPEMEATRPWRHSGFDLFRIQNHSIYHYWYSPWW